MNNATFLYHVYMINGKRREWLYCTCCSQEHFEKRFAELKSANPDKKFVYDRLN